MPNKTVFGRLLELVRTFDANVDAIESTEFKDYLLTRDFYGSPLRGTDIKLARPYPEFPCDLDRYPPHCPASREDEEELGKELDSESEHLSYKQKEDLRTANAKSRLDSLIKRRPDFDVLSEWPTPALPEATRRPDRLLIFLEVLRCIAAPMTDTHVERLESGMLAPGKLKYGYFSQSIRGFDGPLMVLDNEEQKTKAGKRPSLPGSDHLQRRLFRETFLASYMHVLLRHVAASHPAFIRDVVNVLHDRKRGECFRQALESLAPDPGWQCAINMAFHCIRRPTFRDLFLDPTHYLDSLDGLLALPLKNAGAYRFEPAERFVRLPETLAALLHVCVESTGRDANLYADHRVAMHSILDDAERIGRTDDILNPERWVEFELPAGKKQHDRGPSIHHGTLACLCVVLEALAAGVLTTKTDAAKGPLGNDRPEPNMPDADHAELSRTHTPAPDLDAGIASERERKLDLLRERLLSKCVGHRLLIETGLALLNSPPASDSRFLAPESSTADVYSPDVGLVRTQEDLSVQFETKVQQPGQGAFQAGTIWLAIPSSFVERDLPLEVRVMRFDAQTDASPHRLAELNFGVAEQFPHGNGGALLTLEPRYWDDPALPAGFTRGKFNALVSLGLVGTAREPHMLLAVVACVPAANALTPA